MSSSSAEAIILRSSLFEKLKEKEERLVELERELSSPVLSPQLYASYAREHGSLSELVSFYRSYKELVRRWEEAGSILRESDDKELVELAQEEIRTVEADLRTLVREIENRIVRKEEDYRRSVIMEIRAGTGGEEAALFAGDLLRMYTRYAERKGWKVELLQSNSSDLGGVKSAILSLQGPEVFWRLRHESGTHRVQRVPVTEAGGRIHTSTATVAVLPEAEEVEVELKPGELQMEFVHASGPGGQNVNKVASAVRITHIPTGITVSIQDEQSQHKNRLKALRVLRTRLLEHYRREQEEQIASLRRSQIGTGDRSEKIRTYNFPQNRVTDHRIGYTSHNLTEILDGELDEIINHLIQRYIEKQLQEL